ncbi:MAG: PT domain-containing protein [Alistipes sp.]|nr:PT domain-containing protein [Alistipes sp.]
MALIRCKSCNNPISSRLATCPFCGAAVTDDVAQQASTPVVNSINEAAAAPQKTLNDILAERKAQPTTVNEIHTTTVAEPKPAPVAEPKVAPVAEPVAKPKSQPTSQTLYGGEYDQNERILDDYEEEVARYKRSSVGFLTVAVVLLIILIPLTIFAVKNYGKVKTIEQDYALVESARRLFEEQNNMLQRDAESLVEELEQYKSKNDTMMQKYQEAVVMLEQLQREKTYNYNQLAKYRREVDMLKGVMKGYLRQIDSLNDINTDLQAKNVAYEKERTGYQERAEKAEEKAEELNTKVRIGSVIRTGGVRVVALNDNGKNVKRIKVASRLRVDFELTANELAEPGEKTIYVCITDPDGYVLSPADKMIPFTFEGEGRTASAMRKVSYENESVPVSVFYDGSAFQKGTYKVDIYIEGRHCGSGNTYFE